MPNCFNAVRKVNFEALSVKFISTKFKVLNVFFIYFCAVILITNHHERTNRKNQHRI